MKSLWIPNWVGSFFFLKRCKTFQRQMHTAEAKVFVLFKISVYSDPNDRIVIAEIKLGDEVFSASVYAPCDSQQQFLFSMNLCTEIVSKTNTSRIIIADIWSTTLHSIVNLEGVHGKKQKLSLQFYVLIRSFSCLSNPTPKKNAFTYESKPLKLKSRIDFFFSHCSVFEAKHKNS